MKLEIQSDENGYPQLVILAESFEEFGEIGRLNDAITATKQVQEWCKYPEATVDAATRTLTVGIFCYTPKEI